MAQSYTDSNGTLYIPGAYATWKAQSTIGGLAANGILMLVGEADMGPSFSQETKLADNMFGPDSLADVVAKYGSGPLVDAFRVACSPANDPDITGAPSGILICKTNTGTRAQLDIAAVSGTYGTLVAKSYGQLGNLIYFNIAEKVAEVAPTTGAFTYIPPAGIANANIRVNGAAAAAVSVTANMTPAAFVTAVNAAVTSLAAGGVSRAIMGAASGSLSLVASGNNVVVTYTGTWATTPTVGDTLVIPVASVLNTPAGNKNVGAYVITAATASTITATKLSDAGAPSPVPGTITAPANQTAISVVSTTADIMAYSPVTFTQSATLLPGLAKVLEVNQLTTGTDLLNRTAYVLGTTTPVTWISKSGTPVRLVSASEQQVQVNINRQADGIQEQELAGGPVALEIGYIGTTAQVVVAPTTMTITLVGGASSGLSPLVLNLANYPTLADLANYLNAVPGFSARVGTTALGQTSPLALDEGTFDAATDFGNRTMRLKMDAVAFAQAVNGSYLLQLGDGVTPAAGGLPAVQASYAYLAGGAKGGTTDAQFNLAVDALKKVTGNFVIPLFSQDASADIALGLTDSASTYTVANIQQYTLSHCIAMSAYKKRKFRQAFLSRRSTMVNVKEDAANIASFRASLAFEDFKAVGANGIVQLQPWATAVDAAAMQAAGFYRSITHKGMLCSGVLQAAGDFDDNDDDDLEPALKAGLLIAQKASDGGYIWVSDQTTYSRDNNPVYNSIQAVYASDLISATTAQLMEKAFVGQSQADVSAQLGLSFLEAIMAQFMGQKLIAPSDDAPRGFKDAIVRLNGNAMTVSANVKVAGTIYFIPIQFTISQVVQSAGAATS